MSYVEEIDSHQLAALLEEDPSGVLVVDVRSWTEMAQGVLPNAETVPMHLVPIRVEEWRSQPRIVFYCRTGARSGQVCAYLQQQGLGQVVNLRGGIIDWYRQGYAIEPLEQRRLVG